VIGKLGYIHPTHPNSSLTHASECTPSDIGSSATSDLISLRPNYPGLSELVESPDQPMPLSQLPTNTRKAPRRFPGDQSTACRAKKHGLAKACSSFSWTSAGRLLKIVSGTDFTSMGWQTRAQPYLPLSMGTKRLYSPSRSDRLIDELGCFAPSRADSCPPLPALAPTQPAVPHSCRHSHCRFRDTITTTT